MGKTQILRALFARTGGVHLTSREFVEASAHRDPLALDETIYGVLKRALETHDTVIVDDFQFVSVVACCAHAYPRKNFLAAALLPLAALAHDQGKKLVFTSEGMPLMGLHERFPIVSASRAFTDGRLRGDLRLIPGRLADATDRLRQGPSVRAEAERAPAAQHVRRASRCRWPRYRPLRRVPARAPHGEQRRHRRGPGGGPQGPEGHRRRARGARGEHHHAAREADVSQELD